MWKSEGQTVEYLKDEKMPLLLPIQEKCQFLYFLLAWPLKSVNSHHLGQPEAKKGEREITCMAQLLYLPSQILIPEMTLMPDWSQQAKPVVDTHRAENTAACHTAGAQCPKPPAYKWAPWSPESL